MAEYYIKQISDTVFEVSKFGDSDLPVAVYTVEYNSTTGKGKCNCPAAIYRKTGSKDKHVQLIIEWLNSKGEISAEDNISEAI